MIALGDYPSRAGRPDRCVMNIRCDVCNGPYVTFEGPDEKSAGHKARDAGWRFIDKKRGGRVVGPCCRRSK